MNKNNIILFTLLSIGTLAYSMHDFHTLEDGRQTPESIECTRNYLRPVPDQAAFDDEPIQVTPLPDIFYQLQQRLQDIEQNYIQVLHFGTPQAKEALAQRYEQLASIAAGCQWGLMIQRSAASRARSLRMNRI